MNCSLKHLTLALILSVAAQAADRTILCLQNRNQKATTGRMTWTLLENGKVTYTSQAEGFKVPSGHYLVITEAAFILRGVRPYGAYSAAFRIMMKSGMDSFDLMESSDELPIWLEAAVVRKTFTPGLVVPSGAELQGVLSALVPKSSSATLDTNFYGYLVPNEQGW